MNYYVNKIFYDKNVDNILEVLIMVAARNMLFEEDEEDTICRYLAIFEHREDHSKNENFFFKKLFLPSPYQVKSI